MSKGSVMLVPCSGIGKVHGLIGREAVFRVTGQLRPHDTELACLAEIVTQDAEVQERMKGRLAITVDGCPKMCAWSVEKSLLPCAWLTLFAPIGERRRVMRQS